MKPTTIKAKTTKWLGDMEHDERGLIKIGGIEHAVHCWDGLVSVVEMRDRGESQCILSRDAHKTAEVTVTEERPMTFMDAEEGEPFVPSEYVDEGDSVRSVCLMVVDGAVYCFSCASGVEQIDICDSIPVTLVTPTFDAEPIEDSAVMPVGEVSGRFEFQGQTGQTCRSGMNWQEVRWDVRSAVEPLAWIPIDTPVTVHTEAYYESWDDVSVGDVAFDDMAEQLAIYLGGAEWLAYNGKTYAAPTNASEFTPARLTDVSWDRIDSIERDDKEQQ